MCTLGISIHKIKCSHPQITLFESLIVCFCLVITYIRIHACILVTINYLHSNLVHQTLQWINDSIRWSWWIFLEGLCWITDQFYCEHFLLMLYSYVWTNYYIEHWGYSVPISDHFYCERTDSLATPSAIVGYDHHLGKYMLYMKLGNVASCWVKDYQNCHNTCK